MRAVQNETTIAYNPALRSLCDRSSRLVIDIGLRKVFALKQQRRALGAGVGETIAHVQLRGMAPLAEGYGGYGDMIRIALSVGRINEAGIGVTQIRDCVPCPRKNAEN
jgi:hypothetical protein